MNGLGGICDLFNLQRFQLFAEPQALAEPELMLFRAQRRHALFNHVVPRRVRRFANLTCSGDDQPVFGPCHADIKQPVTLFCLCLFDRVFGLCMTRGLFVFRGLPDDLIAIGDDLVPQGASHLATVGHDHNRRFQSFRTVNRHHANTVTSAFGAAFDFKIVGAHPLKEAGQRRHRGFFVNQSLLQQ